MIYLQLFYEFFKVGLFSVGGGLATIPFLQELSVRTGWFTLADLANMLAVAESTPGPIGVNTATYVGFTVAGLLGGIISTLGLIAPAFIIGGIIATMMQKFRQSSTVQKVFSGLRPASVALIAAAGAGVAKIVFVDFAAYEAAKNLITLLDWKSFALAAAVLVMTRIKKLSKLHPCVFIAFGAAAGIIFNLAR